MPLTAAEFSTLTALRERFLHSAPGSGGYWRSQEELALYDATFGERIGWKWDAVLRELGVRGWSPRSRVLVDWGCGSGVAGRRVLRAWPAHFERVVLHDSSGVAREFARDQMEREF